MAALTTPEQVKRYMRLAGDEHDDALEQLIDAVSDAIEQYCRRPFAMKPTTEIFDAPRGPHVFLRRRPVCEIVAVWDDATRQFAPSSKMDPSEYLFDPDTGILSRVIGRFGSARRAVRVDYVGGYDTPPPSITQAANVLVAHYFLRGQQGGDGLASESLGGYAVSFDAADWPGTAKTLLAEFREWQV